MATPTWDVLERERKAAAPEVARLQSLMGTHVMVLRVPFDDENAATLVQRPNWPHRTVVDPVPVPNKTVRDWLITQLFHMNCHDVLQRGGWKGAGLDGDRADYYCFVQ